MFSCIDLSNRERKCSFINKWNVYILINLREIHTDARIALETNVSIVGGICRHLSTCCSRESSVFPKEKENLTV